MLPLVCDLDPTIGFNVGWDYARCGISPHPERLADPIYRAVRDGWAAGKQRFSTVFRRPDRFTRKWLQVRLSAWRRNRVFDESITPDFLKTIDVSYCPITRAPLTHSTGKDTDWSVDRVLNRGAYARGNLVVMSAKANTAKGDLDHRDIMKRCESALLEGCEPEGLTAMEWARLAYLSSLVIDGASALPMILVAPPQLVVANRWYPLQYALMHGVAGYFKQQLHYDLRNATPGKKAKRTLDTFIACAIHRMQGAYPAPHDAQAIGLSARDVRRYAVAWAIEDAWSDGHLLDVFQDWIGSLDATAALRCISIAMGQHGGLRRCEADVYSDWALESKGYRRRPAAVPRPAAVSRRTCIDQEIAHA